VSEQPQRVWVFIDSQNVYRDARRAFHGERDPARCGQIDPRRLADLLTERGPEDDPRARLLTSARVYTGAPGAREPRAHSAHMRQRAAWERSGVEVRARPLRYPTDWPQSPAVEKGVDVSLAVDLVFAAARRSFDVGIVLSTDTDLVPALEAVCELRRAWGEPRLEVASWGPTKKRLRVKGFPVWCHWLQSADYEQVRDLNDYASDRGRRI